MNQRNMGRHYAYPNSFTLILSYGVSFHLPYRQTKGLMKEIGEELPERHSFSQINRRVNQLNVRLKIE